MKIDGIDQSQFFNILGKNSEQAVLKEQTEVAVAKTDLPNALSSTALSTNLMSRNFFNSNYERSAYVQATISNHEQQQAFNNRMNTVLTSLVGTAAVWDSQRTFGGSDPIENTYVIGNRMVNAAGQAVSDVKRDEDVKSSKENLDEIKEDLENRSQEALSNDSSEDNVTRGEASLPDIKNVNTEVIIDNPELPPTQAPAFVVTAPVESMEAPVTPSIDVVV